MRGFDFRALAAALMVLTFSSGSMAQCQDLPDAATMETVMQAINATIEPCVPLVTDWPGKGDIPPSN